MAHYKDMKGLRLGRLTVVEMVGFTEHKSAIWKCVCDCGEKVKVSASDLRSGHQLSCGCLRSKGEFLIRDFLLRIIFHTKNKKRLIILEELETENCLMIFICQYIIC